MKKTKLSNLFLSASQFIKTLLYSLICPGKLNQINNGRRGGNDDRK